MRDGLMRNARERVDEKFYDGFTRGLAAEMVLKKNGGKNMQQRNKRHLRRENERREKPGWRSG